jgi:hypothetical protein
MPDTYSIFTAYGVLAYSGPGGHPFATLRDAQYDADARSRKAEAMGLKVRYEVGPGRIASTKYSDL